MSAADGARRWATTARSRTARWCMVPRSGAMALVPPGVEIPEGSVVMGVPGKIVATRDNFLATRRNALIYHRNALAYAEGRHDAWRGEDFKRWRDDVVRRLAEGEEVGHLDLDRVQRP